MDIAALDEFEQFLDHDKNEYIGQIQSWAKSINRKQIHPLITKANNAYENAKRRCNNNKYPTYKNISVEFSKREFIYWWIVQSRFFKLEKPTLGRINHYKNYSFDNIRLEEHSYNSAEARSRFPAINKYGNLEIYKNKKLIAIACSAHQASKYLDISEGKIRDTANGVYKQMKVWEFKYVN